MYDFRTTLPVPPCYPSAEEMPMTLCAAAICDGGKAIVTVADKFVGFESPASKWSQLNKSCVVLWAGEHPNITGFVNKVKNSIQDTNPTTEDIARIVCVVFQEDRKKQNELKFLSPIGMTLEILQNKYRHNMPSLLAEETQNNLIKAPLGLTLIVCGIDNEEGHLFVVQDPGFEHVCDDIGFAAIGMTTLTNDYLGQKGGLKALSNADAILELYRAKKRAEVYDSVGEKTEMTVITSDEVRKVPEEEFKKGT